MSIVLSLFELTMINPIYTNEYVTYKYTANNNEL